MYNFTDLIVRSYLLYTDKLKKNKNIAHFFFQEYHLVRPDANEKYIFSKTQFYIELIEKIDSFLSTCKHNYEVEESLYYDVCIEDKDFKAWERIDLKKKQAIYDEDGIYFTLSFFNWEEIENAEHLNEALVNGLNLKDPIFIISPNKDIQAKDLVLRKSKLEYLKTEAIRARDAKDIEELDVNGLLPSRARYNSLNDSKPKRDEIVQEFIIKALEIIKPLGGIYILDSLLDDVDMKRLNNYVVVLITTGNLPSILLPFPRTVIPSQFIRKTMHMVYILIGKKYRSEFIELTHLFKQFEGTEPSTTDSKFLTYEGNYEKTKSKITFKN